jgi:hypothetical protein
MWIEITFFECELRIESCTFFIYNTVSVFTYIDMEVSRFADRAYQYIYLSN